MEIPLTQRLVAVIDDEDFKKISKYKWCAKESNGKKFYAVSYSGGGRKNPTLVRMHNVIASPPEGYVVDHVNGNSLDNRKENLRICTQTQNCYNSRAKKGRSKFKGVSKHANTKKWRAYIAVKRKQIHLGFFEKEVDAAVAYNNAAREYFGEHAKLNRI